MAQQQLVEITKALSFKSRLIVMDEPTAALSEREVERLLSLVRLAAQGGACSMCHTGWPRCSQWPTVSRCCGTAITS